MKSVHLLSRVEPNIRPFPKSVLRRVGALSEIGTAAQQGREPNIRRFPKSVLLGALNEIGTAAPGYSHPQLRQLETLPQIGTAPQTPRGKSAAGEPENGA